MAFDGNDGQIVDTRENATEEDGHEETTAGPPQRSGHRDQPSHSDYLVYSVRSRT